MKRKIPFVLAFVAATALSAAEEWPLITVRHTTVISRQPELFAKQVELHLKYPGACDEFWFATDDRKTVPELEKECALFARYRPLCEKAGIRLSFQQGLTLGHSQAHDGPPQTGEQAFPADAWQVGKDGKRLGFLCPRSPTVFAYEKEYVKTVLRVANPWSYWLDDDLRLGICKPDGCFCERCLKAFNEKTGGNWTREVLVAKLYSKNRREAVRADWTQFNAESLACYAAAARAAADELGSPCRLAYQSVWSDTIYTGRDLKPLLEALSGPDRRSVGIRPGAGFYVEAEPRGMVFKNLSVAREAERCRGCGFVGSMRYEQETYPRHLLHKSPGAIITESALALASGCNSLSLYWYAGEAPEPLAEYERFVKVVAAARPYFERLRDSVTRTCLGGVARYVGTAAGETFGFDLRDEADMWLACMGVPVTVAESGAKTWYLTPMSVNEMTDDDWCAIAKGGAVVPDGLFKILPAAAKVAADGRLVRVDDFEPYPLTAKRAALLDALDAMTPGGLCVRLDECRPVRILPRVRPDGTVDSVTLLSLSIGDTDEIHVRVRRPTGAKPMWMRGKRAEATPLLTLPGKLPGEIVVRLPNLPGWQIGTIFF
jgi:uncharacterized C2H2 Zn-finger protein